MPLQLVKILVMLVALGLAAWVLMWMWYKRRSSADLTRRHLLSALTVYLFLVAFLTIVPMRWATTPGPALTLVPILPLITGFTQASSSTPQTVRFQLENLIGNILIFIPLGVLLPAAWPRFESFGRVAIAAASVSAFIELTQYVSHFFGSYRQADVNDVILNTLGGCLGLVIFKFASGRIQK